jgi:4-hydroxy-4-methyl-2-oxoglutarate aldolase
MAYRPNEAQLATLKRLGTATVHEAQGQKGAFDSGLKPLDPSRRLAGSALTVECRPSDNLAIHFALLKARPGDVLVVDAKGFVEAGPWGDIMTLAAQQAGVAGLVIDGSVRDSDSIIRMGFPTYSRALSIKGTGKAHGGRVDVPIICGGVVIRPGDIILGDRDGLVAIAQEEIDLVIRLSEERERKEEALRIALRSGRTTVELLGLQTMADKIQYA